ncbi:MAG: hypothetical protein AAB656_02130 [Patescibacteria group bacterium]
MQKSNDYFWSLIIEPSWVQASIWYVDSESKKAEVVAVSPPGHWENEEELLASSDACLSSAVSELPEDITEPTKTVFGVSPSWVEEGQIKDEYLEKIKTLCGKLSLVPSGFVVLTEAIAYFIKAQEGAPISGVLIGIGAEVLDISVFKLGNLVGTVSVARSVSVTEDVVEGLARFKGQDIPSRFLIYDGKEGQLNEVKNELTSFDWTSSDKVKLLHIPKIEIIEPREKVLAVSLAGASEIGEASAIEFEPREERPEAGFKMEEIESNVEEVPDEASAFGFTANEIKEEFEPPPVPLVSTPQNLEVLNKAKLFALGIWHKIDNFEPKVPKNSFLVGLVGLATIFILGFVAWWVMPKATVTIYVSPKKVDAEDTVSIKTKAVSIETEGDKTMSVTGTKTIGDRAKGGVTIYNASSDRTIDSGTKITNSSGLVFTLDSNISIASGSASTPSTTSASVTAVDIGAQYNLASGATFSISGFTSSIDAKNESAFSGGSSTEITAVSEGDRKDLLASLTKELIEKGKDKLMEDLPTSEVLIEDATTATASAINFDHKVGDEASNLKLSLTVKTNGFSASKGDLGKLAENALRDKVTGGFVLRPDQIKYQFEVVSKKKDIIEAKVRFTANLLPEINITEIAKKIVGKSRSSAEDILSLTPGYTRNEIKFNFSLPSFLATLPHLVKNITLEVAAEK